MVLPLSDKMGFYTIKKGPVLSQGIQCLKANSSEQDRAGNGVPRAHSEGGGEASMGAPRRGCSAQLAHQLDVDFYQHVKHHLLGTGDWDLASGSLSIRHHTGSNFLF